MYDISIAPTWTIPFFICCPILVALVVLAIELIIRLRTTRKFDDVGLLAFFSFTLSILILAIIGFSGVFSTQYIGDNPTTADFKERFIINVKEFELEERVMEEADIDSLRFEEDSKQDLFVDLRNGDFVDFEGIKEDSRISGSVYFTKDSMVILIEDESTAKEKIVVLTGE